MESQRQRLTFNGRTPWKHMNNSNEDDQERDWSSLTDLALVSIVRHLDSMVDFESFRNTCSTWRSIAAHRPDNLHSQSPLLLLTCFPSANQSLYDISRDRLYKTGHPWQVYSRYALSYAHGYIVTMSRTRSAKIQLKNIFTGSQIELPSIPRDYDIYWEGERELRGFLTGPPSSDHCLLVLFHRGKNHVAFCQLSSSKWKIHVNDHPLHNFEDIIFFKNKFYALIWGGKLVTLDLSENMAVTINHVGDDPMMNELKEERRYQSNWMLAKSDKDLFYVCFRHSLEIFVYRWDFEVGRWVQTRSVGDKTLFLGSGGFGGCMKPNGSSIKSNCVYYADGYTNKWYEFLLVDDDGSKILRSGGPGWREIYDSDEHEHESNEIIDSDCDDHEDESNDIIDSDSEEFEMCETTILRVGTDLYLPSPWVLPSIY